MQWSAWALGPNHDPRQPSKSSQSKGNSSSLSDCFENAEEDDANRRGWCQQSRCLCSNVLCVAILQLLPLQNCLAPGSVMVVAISSSLMNTPKSDNVSQLVPFKWSIFGEISMATVTIEMHSASKHAAQGHERHRGRGEGLHTVWVPRLCWRLCSPALGFWWYGGYVPMDFWELWTLCPHLVMVKPKWREIFVGFPCTGERVTGRKARGLKTEEIACKHQTFLSLLSGRRKQTSDIFSLSIQI